MCCKIVNHVAERGCFSALETKIEMRRKEMKPDSKRFCPHCGSSEVFRSHRHGAVEKYLLRAIGVRPFRCVNCDARFLRLKGSDDPARMTERHEVRGQTYPDMDG